MNARIVVTSPTELEAIQAQFVLAVADATRQAVQQRLGLLPPPPQSVIADLARRESAVAARQAVTA